MTQDKQIVTQVANTLKGKPCQSIGSDKSLKCTGIAVCTVPFHLRYGGGNVPMCARCAKGFIWTNNDHDDFR